MVRRRNVAACLALILLCGAMPVSVYATEETKQLINQAEQEKKDTENKLNETEQNLKGLNEQKDSLQGTLTTLNTELSQLEYGNLRTNINIPSLGKLNCTYNRYIGIRNRFNIINKIRQKQ